MALEVDDIEIEGTLKCAGIQVGLIEPVFTVDFMDALTADIYAPFDCKINTVSNMVSAPATTLKVDDIAYNLGDDILKGEKITVTVDLNAVIQLNTLLI